MEVNREKKVVFSTTTTSEVFSCQRLRGGNTWWLRPRRAGL